MIMPSTPFGENSRAIRGDTTIKSFCENCGHTLPFINNSDTFEFKANRGEYIFYQPVYWCKTCEVTQRRVAFTLNLSADDSGHEVMKAYKYGELPPFGSTDPTPMKKYLGGDWDTYLKGKQSEAQSLGIGACAYYRRIVERSRTQLLQKSIEIAELLLLDPEVIENLKKARDTKNFTESLELAKGVFPKVLYLGDHNPFKILHEHLSDGIHNLSDEEFLEIAKEIRVLLEALAEKMQQIMRQERHVHEAITTLSKKKRKQPLKPKPKPR